MKQTQQYLVRTYRNEKPLVHTKTFLHDERGLSAAMLFAESQARRAEVTGVFLVTEITRKTEMPIKSWSK